MKDKILFWCLVMTITSWSILTEFLRNNHNFDVFSITISIVFAIIMGIVVQRTSFWGQDFSKKNLDSKTFFISSIIFTILLSSVFFLMGYIESSGDLFYTLINAALFFITIPLGIFWTKTHIEQHPEKFVVN